MKRPSKRLIEALIILRDKKPRTFAYFAELYWPDNHMHKRISNCGTHGARRGAGAWRAAGGYLGKLEKKGLIRKQFHETMIRDFGIASLTQEAHKILAQHGNEKSKYKAKGKT